jgi:hypothetical protein
LNKDLQLVFSKNRHPYNLRCLNREGNYKKIIVNKNRPYFIMHTDSFCLLGFGGIHYFQLHLLNLQQPLPLMQQKMVYFFMQTANFDFGL